MVAIRSCAVSTIQASRQTTPTMQADNRISQNRPTMGQQEDIEMQRQSCNTKRSRSERSRRRRTPPPPPPPTPQTARPLPGARRALGRSSPPTAALQRRLCLATSLLYLLALNTQQLANATAKPDREDTPAPRVPGNLIEQQLHLDVNTENPRSLDPAPEPQLAASVSSNQQSDGLEPRHDHQTTSGAGRGGASDRPAAAAASRDLADKRTFVIELLKMLHEQYGRQALANATTTTDNLNAAAGGAGVGGTTRLGDKMESRQSIGGGGGGGAPGGMMQLLEALGADGDMRRLIDWVRNSFNLASVGEVATQFVVGKLGSVNCPALLAPDKEETLVPRFLLFNEHYVDVPFELSINPSASECLANGRFDPLRRTIVLVHGYLAGYTLLDGLTNIKNRVLDLNKLAGEQALEAFVKASESNGSYLLTEDLQLKVRRQMYNVIIVDWFNGANPAPRANYIRAAVNAQVVGRLIARFLSALVVQCGTPASNLQIIAHSLGCHVSGFTGKELNAAGHRLGKITHLDPVGLCFGRLFSRPQLRLSPSDALETQAVHVSLNIFDNPLDGAHSNFLVNGGRDQIGCGGQSELKNSTSSSVSLLFDSAAKFNPCSHLRALALYETDLSSRAGQCQMVGYRCPSYERFLAGKCGQCDAANSQCRLMSLPPINLHFQKLHLDTEESGPSQAAMSYHDGLQQQQQQTTATATAGQPPKPKLPDIYYYSQSLVGAASNTSSYLSYANDTGSGASGGAPMLQPHYSIINSPSSSSNHSHHQYQSAATTSSPALTSTTRMYGAPSNYVALVTGNELKRADRRLDHHHQQQQQSQLQGNRIVQVIGKIRQDTRTAIAGSLTSLRNFRDPTPPAQGGEYWTSETGGSNEAAKQLPGEEPPPPSEQSPGTTVAAPNTSHRTSPAPSEQLAASGASKLGGEHQHQHQHQQRLQASDFADQLPLGSQRLPSGALNGPLYFLGTSSLDQYCVNYYQFRVLIAESRLQRILKIHGLASNRLAPPIALSGQQSLVQTAWAMQQRIAEAQGRDMLHLTVKLVDSGGHFFKGFSILEHARHLTRVANDLPPPPPPARPHLSAAGGAGLALGEPMFELTMLLNTTSSEPVRVSETIISYYFHSIVLADRVEVNYMSNISPDVRARYSSVLCPVAINDRHQLVRYIECHKVDGRRRRRRR